jgi:hypothetical protein
MTPASHCRHVAGPGIQTVPITNCAVIGDDWLASQYRKAAEAIDAQLAAGSITAGAR